MKPKKTLSTRFNTPYQMVISNEAYTWAEWFAAKRCHTIVSVADAMNLLGKYGSHGAIDEIEGAVWRVERNELIDPRKGGERRPVVDFLAKFVRPDKVDGCFLASITNEPEVWNWKET